MQEQQQYECQHEYDTNTNTAHVSAGARTREREMSEVANLAICPTREKKGMVRHEQSQLRRIRTVLDTREQNGLSGVNPQITVS